MFDVSKIMATTFEDANSTQSIPVPEGEYLARVEKVDVRVINTKNGDRAILTVVWVPEDSDGRIKTATGRDRASVKQDLFLDLTPESNLDMGKGMNSRLGVLREALSQNTPGRPWGFNMLVGNMARILVTHRQTDDGPFADVKSVTKL